MGIGKRIQELCKTRGLSVHKLSIMANVPYSTLYSMIKRDSEGADGETLNRLAKALNVSVVEILINPADMVDILSQTITNESIKELEAKLKSGAERWNAFVTVLRAVGYDVVVEKNADSEDSYTFCRKDKTWMHQIQEQDIVAMLHESLGYTEYLCVRMEKTLDEAPPAPAEAAPTSPEGKDQGGGDNA